MSSTIRLAFAKRRKRSQHPGASRRAAACAAPVEEQSHLPQRSAVGAYEGMRAVTSLSRAFSGSGTIEDAGTLAWLILRQVVASDAIAIFLPDGETDGVRAQFAAGVHAERLRGLRQPAGTGIAGWVYDELLPAINAEPARDFDTAAEPALRWCIAVPLIDGDAVAGVLALYRSSGHAYSEGDLRTLELLAPRLAASVLDSSPSEADTAAAAAAPKVLALRLVK